MSAQQEEGEVACSPRRSSGARSPPASATRFRRMCCSRSIRSSEAVPTRGPMMRMGPTTSARCSSIRPIWSHSGDSGSPPKAVDGKTCHPWFLAAWCAPPGAFTISSSTTTVGFGPGWRAWLIAQHPTIVSAPGFHSADAPTPAISREMPAAATRAESRPIRPRRAEPRRLRDYRRFGVRDRRATGSQPPRASR